MNENIDLTKILKDCPEGWKFYSSIYGDVAFRGIENDSANPIKFFLLDEDNIEKYGSCTEQGLYAPYYKGECTFFPSKEQRDWNKFTAPWYNGKNEQKSADKIEPKFKVGDRVRHKETNKDDVYEISKVYDDSYGIVGFNWVIYMKYQDQYELVSNKFDPKILKPFDDVLVFDNNTPWTPLMFSYLEYSLNYPRMQCFDFVARKVIPYNDETKYLIGTTKEAPKYYRYWEE